LEFLGTRVMGVIKQAGLKGLGHSRLVITQDSWEKAHDCIGECERPEHTVGEDVVSDRDLIVNKMVGHTLINPLIVPAEKNQMLRLGVLVDDLLSKWSSLRGKENNLGLRPAKFCQCRSNWLDLHNHAWPSPVGGIIDRTVPVVGPTS